MKIKRAVAAAALAVSLAAGLAGPAMASDSVVSNAPYDRQAAVDWALEHAQDPEPFPASCTWFVTNALWAGGLPKDAGWNADGEHGRLQKSPGTPSATAAQPLLDYLSARYPYTKPVEMDFTGNAVPQAEPGDIVAYDWEGDGRIDHLALVVDIAPGQYPEVAEWGTDDTHPTGYVKRGWTYSEKDEPGWLQDKDKHPAVKAWLWHIDTTYLPTF
ncbi:amidase domain-containing protein [Streptomyces sp. NPDC048191]|uniref:amidase domain-containing protein n=1 Tax=Streptomyces sp. NPDC048191 TaxID=3155484 RepID=UPI0033E9D079